MKDIVYRFSPLFLQNALISLYNIQAYRKRYGGRYKEFRKVFKNNRGLPLDQLKLIQERRYQEFLLSSLSNSSFYRELYKDIQNPELLKNIHLLPIVSKEDLRKNIGKVVIQTTERLEKSKTGGTTGKSLEVKYRLVNTQERFAMLDDFRSQFGYELGRRTAWFSGKNLLTSKDIQKNRFWKTDVLHKVRYYSTFHIKEEYLRFYLEDLIRYCPEYMVGFPSSILEIAKYGIANGYNFPKGKVKAIFPTAETVTTGMRSVIEGFFNARMYDQYASSEGAPFIFECRNGNLHLELQSGIFEVLDEENNRAKSGRLVITSFTTEATPLIRYDIGDSITLEEETKICDCGNNNPMVKEILGRIDDYIYSPETGKINLGNVSNTLKDTRGILKFQVIQDSLNKISINLVVDEDEYNKGIENRFIQNWRDRVGRRMEIELEYVDDIPVEASGKFRIVKNLVKHLIE